MPTGDFALYCSIVVVGAFAVFSGAISAAQSIATLVATRAAHPTPAMVMAAVAGVVGPLLLGAAVANTIATIVSVPGARATPVIGAGVTGALAWLLLTWWWELPSSSSHALIGGLAGAAWLDSGLDAVNWGPWHDGRIDGVLGVLFGMAVAVVGGFALTLGLERLAVRVMQRATVRMLPILRAGEWFTAGWLALGQGANNAMKSVGLVGALLVANGRLGEVESISRGWILVISLLMSVGATVAGWSIVKTIGRRIFPLHSVDGLVSQTVSATVILTASTAGVPLSTTQVVASSIVGIGVGRRRFRHVGWSIVRNIALAWVTTIPVTAVLGALALPLWRLV